MALTSQANLLNIFSSQFLMAANLFRSEDRDPTKHIVSLDAGTIPKNGESWKEWLHRLLVHNSAEYIIDERFNEEFEGDDDKNEDQLAKLDRLQSQSQRVKLEQQGGQQEEKPGFITFSTERSTENRRFVAFDGRRTVFVDPVATFQNEQKTQVPEDAAARKRRHIVYGAVVQSLSQHHLSIVQSAEARWGNVYYLINLVDKRMRTRDPSAFLDSVILAVNITRPASESWHNFAERIFKTKVALEQITDSDYMLPPGLLLEVVLRAMARTGSTAFVNAAALLRMENPKPDVNRALSRLLEVVGESGDSGLRTGGATHLTALQARAGGVRPRPSKGVCWRWADTGACSFGDECRFQHPGSSKGKGAGVCFECGSAKHGIHNCSIYKARKEAEKKRGPRAALAEMGEEKEQIGELGEEEEIAILLAKVESLKIASQARSASGARSSQHQQQQSKSSHSK